MTLIWLIAWLVYGTPALHDWNGWVVGLVVCVGLDLFGRAKA